MIQVLRQLGWSCGTTLTINSAVPQLSNMITFSDSQLQGRSNLPHVILTLREYEIESPTIPAVNVLIFIFLLITANITAANTIHEPINSNLTANHL